MPGESEEMKWVSRGPNNVGGRTRALCFDVLDETHKKVDQQLDIFTTRPDTIFGASFCAISPMHPLAKEISKTDKIKQKTIALRKKQYLFARYTSVFFNIRGP